MPTYDYRCRACGHRFELFQAMTEPVKRKCPKCARSALERLIGTGAALLFKGSGFYQTDYRSESYTKAAEAEKKPAGESKPPSNGKSGAAAGGSAAVTTPAPDSAPAKPRAKRARRQ